MDLKNDPYAIAQQISRMPFVWKRILETALNLATHWKDMAAGGHLSGGVEIELPTGLDGTIKGGVLGKQFKLHLTPVLKGGNLKAEVRLTVLPGTGETEFEIARFLMDGRGSIYSTNLDLLLDAGEDMHSFTLFTNLLNLVLQAESPVNAK